MLQLHRMVVWYVDIISKPMELKVYSKVSKREPAERISIQAYVETQYPVMLHNATERQHTNCFVYWKRVIFLQLVLNVRKLSIFYYIYFNSEITQWMLQNVYLNKTNIYIHSVLSYNLFQKETRYCSYWQVQTTVS